MLNYKVITHQNQLSATCSYMELFEAKIHCF